MKVYWEWRYSATHYLTSALDGGEWSASYPGHFTPRERAPGTHWLGGWADCWVHSSGMICVSTLKKIG
jgi:hypothetical protein